NQPSRGRAHDRRSRDAERLQSARQSRCRRPVPGRKSHASLAARRTARAAAGPVLLPAGAGRGRMCLRKATEEQPEIVAACFDLESETTRKTRQGDGVNCRVPTTEYWVPGTRRFTRSPCHPFKGYWVSAY